MKQPKNILIIRFSAMGDVVLTVPVIKSFRAAYPTANITILTNPFFHPFFDGIPNITLPIVALKGKHKGVLGLRKLVQELTIKQKYDVVIDLHSVLRSWVIGFFFKLKRIPIYKINKGRKQKKDFLQDITKPQLPHSTDRYHDVFTAAGFNFSLQKHFLSPNKDSDLSNFINKSEINIGIAPFAAHKSKEWGIDKVEELIKQVNDLKNVNFYMFGGGKTEVEKLNILADKFDTVTSLAGKHSLRHEIRLISQLNVMICMDSGNMHIASLSGIPVISIWGGTHPKVGFSALYQPLENNIQLPLKDQKKCAYTVFGTSENQIEVSPYFCIRKIETQPVLDCLLKVVEFEKV